MAPRSSRAALVVGALAISALTGAGAAAGAATTVALGAPLGQLGAPNAGSIPLSAGQPWTRAEVSTGVGGGWTFASPGKGNIVQVSYFFEVSTGPGQIRVIAVDPTARTVVASSGDYPVDSTPVTSTRVVSTSVPIAAGQVPGLAGTGSYQVATSNDGGSSSSSLNGSSATPAVGSALTLSAGSNKLMQARYTVALAPAATTAPSIASGSAPVAGTALVGSDGTWDSSPTAYSQQWVRCSASGASCTAIAGATSASYTPTAADAGSTLRYRVTASNVEGGTSDPVDSAPTGVVSNGAFPPPPPSPAAVTTALFFAPNDPPQPKVTLCHATASASNPYVVITVAPESVFTRGHDQHQDRRDIIPPFDYVKNGKTLTYPGLNWDARGRAIYGAGCATPQSTPQQQILDPPPVSKVTICHATASGPNCQVDVPPEEPKVIVDVVPPDDPGPRDITYENPGPTPDERPELIVPVVPGVIVTPVTPGVRCSTVAGRVRCRSASVLVPGRSIGLRVSGRSCRTQPVVLGAVAVARRAGPGSVAGSSSALTRVGGCSTPVTG